MQRPQWLGRRAASGEGVCSPQDACKKNRAKLPILPKYVVSLADIKASVFEAYKKHRAHVAMIGDYGSFSVSILSPRALLTFPFLPTALHYKTPNVQLTFSHTPGPPPSVLSANTLATPGTSTGVMAMSTRSSRDPWARTRPPTPVSSRDNRTETATHQNPYNARANATPRKGYPGTGQPHLDTSQEPVTPGSPAPVFALDHQQTPRRASTMSRSSSARTPTAARTTATPRARSFVPGARVPAPLQTGGSTNVVYVSVWPACDAAHHGERENCHICGPLSQGRVFAWG